MASSFPPRIRNGLPPDFKHLVIIISSQDSKKTSSQSQALRLYIPSLSPLKIRNVHLLDLKNQKKIMDPKHQKKNIFTLIRIPS
mmetsp:Transcript_52207/g.53186  ORF Transcript_52207/g.53186 Transcript_52207/m.53186 type:complete len:84 (+) Transcript_52207:152-403(+)